MASLSEVRRTSPAAALVAAAVLAVPLGLPPAAAAPAVSTRATTTDPCAPADTESPVIHEVHLGATAIDVSAGPVAVPVRARVSDGGGSGLASVRVRVGVRDDASGGRWSPGREYAEADLAPAEGDWWAGSITVGQWDGYESPWAVHNVSAWDKAGNYWLRQFLDFYGDRTTTPSFTIAPHPVDEEQPFLEELVLHRRSVDVRRHPADIRVAARVTDKGGSGAASVTVSGKSLSLSSGTTRDGWWRGVLRVPRWTRNGYHRFPVVMKDNAYNGTWAYAAGLRARGMPWRYRAHSVTDSTPPRLLAARLPPPNIEVGPEGSILRVAVRLSDVRAGVASVTAMLIHPRALDTPYVTSLTLRRGTVHDGWWRGVLELPGCGDTAPGSYRVALDLRDRVGNVVRRKAGPIFTVTEAPTPGSG